MIRTTIAITVVLFAASIAQATPSALKPSTIEHIRHPGTQLAGTNCQTTCQWIGGRQFCTSHCF